MTNATKRLWNAFWKPNVLLLLEALSFPLSTASCKRVIFKSGFMHNVFTSGAMVFSNNNPSRKMCFICARWYINLLQISLGFTISWWYNIIEARIQRNWSLQLERTLNLVTSLSTLQWLVPYLLQSSSYKHCKYERRKRNSLQVKPRHTCGSLFQLGDKCYGSY